MEAESLLVEQKIKSKTKTIEELTHVKYECMQNLENGFNITNYIECKAKAIINTNKKKFKSKQKKIELSIKHGDLYLKLKLWRNNLAQEMVKPAYIIASNEQLVDISNMLPLTSDELFLIKGFRKSKCESYSEPICEMVKDFINEHKITRETFIGNKKRS
jgi:superfamily II DNA helicase RecQ